MKLLFPWNYDQIVRSYLQEDKKIMDYDTGGAEYLLSLYEGPHGRPVMMEMSKKEIEKTKVIHKYG